jgi:hypothetical protein
MGLKNHLPNLFSGIFTLRCTVTHVNMLPPPPSEFVRKFRKIFAAQGAPPLTLVANLPPVASVVDTGGNLPPVSLTPVANLQRWPSNCFLKSANSWAQSAIAKSANFF